MNQSLKYAIQSADQKLFRLYLKLLKERSSLLTFLFHEIHADEREIELNVKHPDQRFTIDHLRRFVDYYLANDHSFVGPEDIPANVSSGKKYVLITFDDGYFNNHLILPMLKEYNIPAAFFISTNHIRYNKCFWWDISPWKIHAPW